MESHTALDCLPRDAEYHWSETLRGTMFGNLTPDIPELCAMGFEMR